MQALPIMLALAVFLLSPTGAEAAQAPLHAPPPVDDPRSGPFNVRLDAHDHFGTDQDGVIANALRAWSADGLRAFEICYQARLGTDDWHGATSALAPVARALKARGARIVVAADGGVCDAGTRRSAWPGAYIKILGVAQL